jgi:ABC-2 type transport system ATP-binding protein
MRQKLALARAMVHDPELLVLDEPTAGVDPSGQVEVRDIILNLAHTEGKTIFLSSHNLDEVQRICNRIALIDKGQIKIQGELDKLQEGVGQQELIIDIVAGTADKAEVITKITSQLLALPYVAHCRFEAGHLYTNLNGQSDVSEIVNILSREGIGVEQIKKNRISLEEIYIKAVTEAER